jgi:hypothetical protein
LPSLWIKYFLISYGQFILDISKIGGNRDSAILSLQACFNMPNGVNRRSVLTKSTDTLPRTRMGSMARGDSSERRWHLLADYTSWAVAWMGAGVDWGPR